MGKKQTSRMKFWTLTLVILGCSVGLTLRIDWFAVPLAIALRFYFDSLNFKIPKGKHRFFGTIVVIILAGASFRAIYSLYMPEGLWTPLVSSLSFVLLVANAGFAWAVLSGCADLDRNQETGKHS